jgi:hypothetical protein
MVGKREGARGIISRSLDTLVFKFDIRGVVMLGRARVKEKFFWVVPSFLETLP